MTLLCALVLSMPSFAQGINDKADNIVGEYLTDRGGSKSKVRVTKNADGTYNVRDLSDKLFERNARLVMLANSKRVQDVVVNKLIPRLSVILITAVFSENGSKASLSMSPRLMIAIFIFYFSFV